MKIESVDFFYLSMPEVLDIGDGSQDALLVRVRAGDYEGWGECEASPLVSIASAVAPMSHSACKPVLHSVIGQDLDGCGDITRINRLVRENGFDMLQTDHTLSGIDIALWDLMGKKMGLPVYQMLGYPKAFPKTPYASQLFGDTPEETWQRAQNVRKAGYRAAKFGWGPFGKGTLRADVEQVRAARDGLGRERKLMIDVGTVWQDSVEQARQRLEVLQECAVLWLEEPFVSGALRSYKELADECPEVRLAAGEGCSNFYMAQHLIDHAGIGYIQIDTGRIGGITTATQVADYAQMRRVTYVNHTFTTHLALSASLQPYAGQEHSVICEYPVEPKSLAVELTREKLEMDANGQIRVPEAPGLGVSPDLKAIKKYLVDVEISAKGKTLYHTPTV